MHLTNNMNETVIFIYKAVIATGYTPKEWPKARVVFIPKPGKSDYTSPKAYRPISLTNYLLKGLEKLCRWEMNDRLKEYALHIGQHGFTKGLSTETTISKTVNLNSEWVILLRSVFRHAGGIRQYMS